MTTMEIMPPAPAIRHITVLMWLLRIACSCEFIGHGAFGIITKPGWVPYFGAVGIPPAWAYHLMPVVGSVDILLGMLVLVRPMRWPLTYMVFWGFWTAMLRPLSGEPFWEMIERAPNFLVPLSLLISLNMRKEGIHPSDSPRSSDNPVFTAQPSPIKHVLPWLSETVTRVRYLEWILRLATAGAFIGHGAFGVLMRKPAWYTFLAHCGFSKSVVDEHSLIYGIGGGEMLLGVLVLVTDIPALFLILCGWKLAIEIVWYAYPSSPIWEVVERGSNYTAPLALLLLRGWPQSLKAWFRHKAKLEVTPRIVIGPQTPSRTDAKR